MPARDRWIASASVPVERAEACDGEGDLLALGGRVQQLEDDRVEHRAALDDRAVAELVLADLVDVDARRAGLVRDVDDDRDVGLQAVGGGARAAERDLLLHDAAGRDVAGRAAGLGDDARGLERDEGAEAVVHRARDDAVVVQLERLAGDHGDVADAHELARLVAVLGADVDVQVAQLGDLLALLLAQQVDRLAPDDAGQRAVARDELTALADEDLRIPAADADEAQEAVVVDVRDDQADLVDVADDREQRRAFGRARDARDGGAHDVDRHVVGEGAAGLGEDGRRSGLVAGRAGGGEQLAKDVWKRHAG